VETVGRPNPISQLIFCWLSRCRDFLALDEILGHDVEIHSALEKFQSLFRQDISSKTLLDDAFTQNSQG